MASEKILDYLDSNPVQMGLREEIEELQNKYNELNNQYKI